MCEKSSNFAADFLCAYECIRVQRTRRNTREERIKPQKALLMSQTINANWNQYEASLLVDAYWRIRNGKISKNDATIEVSNRLRQAAISKGLTIDPTYRNTNGISMQLASVEYTLTDGLHGLHSPSKVIADVANMSLDSPEEYETILAEAEVMYPYAPSLDREGTPVLFPTKQDMENDGIKTEFKINPHLQEVLATKFRHGFRLSSHNERKRLSHLYLDIVGKPLGEISDDELSAYGVIYKDMLYLPSQILDEDSKIELLSYIAECFDSGNTFIYYSVLYEHFNQMFSNQKMFDAEMLREYLKKYGDSGWFYKDNMITNSAECSVNIAETVETFIKEYGTIISFTELCNELHHLPREVIMRSIEQKPNKIISGGRELCFHIDNFDINKSDLQRVENKLSSTILSYGYATKSDLIDIIKATTPNVWDNNISLRELGIRNSLYVLLQDKFSFIRNIISSIEHPVDSNSAIDSFCKTHDTTSLAELKAFCLECGSDSIRYEIAYNYYLRINYDTFVHKNTIEFDVNAIDETIEKFTQSSYVSFSDVVLTSFPPSQYPWNIYLLESYLVSCSAKFTLAHERYNQDKVVGAIIKRTSHYDDYSSVITQILAESNIDLNKTEALEFLVDKKYIAFRTFKNIEKILVKAQELRNKMNKK